jgi:CheY-like chemotaxis protein
MPAGTGIAAKPDMKVLVIEDNADLREYLRQALKLEGHEVLSARNGKEALGMLDGKAFDAVVTDLFMPEMDGIETITALRRRLPDARVIAISGRPGVDYLTVARELGVKHTLRKPFEIEELLEALNS